MENLLTSSYWFTLKPEALSLLASKIFVGVIVLFILMTIIAAINKKKRRVFRRFWIKIHTFSFTNAILGIVFLFFNYESLPFFSARFWLGLWLLGMIVWIVFIIINLKTIPDKKEEFEKEKEYKKYLP